MNVHTGKDFTLNVQSRHPRHHLPLDTTKMLVVSSRLIANAFLVKLKNNNRANKRHVRPLNLLCGGASPSPVLEDKT